MGAWGVVSGRKREREREGGKRERRKSEDEEEGKAAAGSCSLDMQDKERQFLRSPSSMLSSASDSLDEDDEPHRTKTEERGSTTSFRAM